jgi:hypothetical protein
MSDVAVLVPVLARPHRVRPFLQSLQDTAPGARAVFIADHDDHDELRAIVTNVRPGDGLLTVTAGGYAAKINLAVRKTTEPLVFLAADDLEFQAGWLHAARQLLADNVHVVGVNDLIPRRRRKHATHFLLTREYALQPTMDGERGPLSEAYEHSFVDDELIATASARNVYRYARGAHVRHEHPMVGAPDDDTYRKGRASYRRDQILFRQRSQIWAT